MAAKTRTSRSATKRPKARPAKPAKPARGRKRAARRKADDSPPTQYITRLKEILITAHHAPSDALRDRLTAHARRLVAWDEIRNAESLDFLVGDDSVFSMPKLRDEYDLAVYLAAMVDISTAEPALELTIDLGDTLSLRAGRFTRDDRGIKEEIARMRASRPCYEGAFRAATIRFPGLAARRDELEAELRRERRGRRWWAAVPTWSVSSDGGDAIVRVGLDGYLGNVLAMLQVIRSSVETLQREGHLASEGSAGSIVLEGPIPIERSFATAFEWYMLASDLSVGRARGSPPGDWMDDLDARDPFVAPAPVAIPELAPILAGRTLRLGTGADLEIVITSDGTMQAVPLVSDDDDDLESRLYKRDAQVVSADDAYAFFRPSPERAYLRDQRTGVETGIDAVTASRIRDCTFLGDELIGVYHPPITMDNLGGRTLVAWSTTRPPRELALTGLDDLRLVPARGIATYLATRDRRAVCGEVTLADFTAIERDIPPPEKAVDWRQRSLVVLPSGRTLFTVRLYRKNSGRVTTELYELEGGAARHLHTIPPLDHVVQVSEHNAIATCTPEPNRQDLARLDWNTGELTSLLAGVTAVPDSGRIHAETVAAGAIWITRSVRRLDEEGGGVSVYSTALIDAAGAATEIVLELPFEDAMSGEPCHDSITHDGTLAVGSLWTSSEGPRLRLDLTEAGRSPTRVEVAWPLPVDETQLAVRFEVGPWARS